MHYRDWKVIMQEQKLPDCDITPTPPLGLSGSPKDVLYGPFWSPDHACQICCDILRVSYEYGGLAHFFMHQSLSNILEGSDRPEFGVDEDMIGTVFSFPLPHSLDAIQTKLSELESHGVPIFSMEEFVDQVHYDAYGPEQCHATVVGMSNPTVMHHPHRISIKLVPHQIVHPPVWITKSENNPHLHHVHNYLDEDAYMSLI